MRRLAHVCLAGMLLMSAAHATDTVSSAFMGDWLAPAEDADDVDAIITLSQQGRVWHGHIKQILPQSPNKKINDSTLCEACRGPQHGHPYRGLEVMWDLQEMNGKLGVGQILDPGDGQVYQCEVQLLTDGKLQVRAYKGLPFLGHTMTWTRPH